MDESGSKTVESVDKLMPSILIESSARDTVKKLPYEGMVLVSLWNIQLFNIRHNV